MNAASIPALARATFKESLRDRLLLVVVVFALGLCLFSRVLGWLSIEDDLKMLQDFSLSGLSVLSLFLAMLVGAHTLAREMERRTAYSVLTRDLHRGEFILGKFAGLVVVFWGCLLGCFAVLLAWLLVWGGSPGAGLFLALAGLLGEVVLLTAVALFLGALANPTLAAVGTLVFYVMGHSTEALRDLTETSASAFHTLFLVLYRVLPNLEDVNFINATSAGVSVSAGELGMGVASVLCWTVVFLLGAAVLFRRREF